MNNSLQESRRRLEHLRNTLDKSRVGALKAEMESMGFPTPGRLDKVLSLLAGQSGFHPFLSGWGAMRVQWLRWRSARHRRRALEKIWRPYHRWGQRFIQRASARRNQIIAVLPRLRK